MQTDSRLIRRRASVVYADICGSTQLTAQLDPEDAHAVMAECVSTLESVARRHGASLVNYRGDGILTAYGIPESYEGAARAAVNAAIDMRSRIEAVGASAEREVSLAVSVGIGTGVVVAGDVSGTDVVEVDLAGDAVGRAARLSDLGTAGQILIDDETRKEVSRDFDFALQGRRTLKGVSEPVSIFEVRSTQPVLHRQSHDLSVTDGPQLVGRGDALATVAQKLQALTADGTGGIVSVSGSAGLGKTRLIRSAQEAADPHALDWTWGRGLQMGSAMSYHLFRDLLFGWVGLGDEGGDSHSSRLRDLLEALFGATNDDRIAALCSVCGAGVGEAELERLDRYPPALRELSVQRAFREWLLALTKRRPQVVTFDDLHWSDASSLRLLESLLPMAHQVPVLFVLLFRPDDEERAGWLLDRAAASSADASVHLPLQPLDDVESRRLAETVLGSSSIDRAVLEEICARAAGNPFMIEEFIEAVLERNAAGDSEKATRWGTGIDIPHSIEEIILSRLALLPEPERSLLDCGAVIGTAFQPHLFEAVLGPLPDMASSLDALVAKGLLVRQHGASGLAYLFRHPVPQQVTYEAISHRERQRLHMAVVSALGRVLNSDDESLPARLAYHYSAAGRLEEAHELLLEAGEHAARCGASDEAILFFGRASEFMLSPARADASNDIVARIERQLALAHFNRGHLPQSEHHFDRYLAVRGQRNSEFPGVQVLRLLRALASVAAEVYFPAARKKRKLATAVDVEVIDVMFGRAMAETQTGVGNFLVHSLETLSKIRRFDAASIPGSGGMLAGAMGIFTFAGLWPRASSHFLDLGEAASNPDDASEQLRVRAMRYFNSHFLGPWDDALRVPDALVREAERAGDLWEVVTYLAISGKQLVHQGRFGEIPTILDRLQDIETSYAYKLARQNRLAVATLLDLERGTFEQALGHSELHLLSIEAHDTGARIFCLGLQAKVLIQLGELEAAAEALAMARSEMRSTPFASPFQASSMYRSEAMLAARLATNNEALRSVSELHAYRTPRLRRPLRIARRNIAEYVQIERHSFEWALANEKWSVARTAWTRAANAAAELGMFPELARLELGLQQSQRMMDEVADARDGVRRAVSAERYPDDPILWADHHGIEWSPHERTEQDDV